jgi:ribosomal-protein-alanine N-acetyltransferase
MHKIEIVPFNESHVDDVLKISIMGFKTPWTRESIQKELDNSAARYLVAIKDDVVIGFGGLWLILDEGHVTNIAVHPEYRGIGAGDMLLEGLIEICKLEGIASMTLEVRVSNTSARNLYKKHGFIEEGIRKKYYTDTNEDGVIMWKYNILA